MKSLRFVISMLIVLVQFTYAPAQIATTHIHEYEYNPTAILALSLARSGNLMAESDMNEVIQSLDKNGTVPRRYQATFETLLKTAQMILEIKAAPHFFPIGYEFETGHHSIDSLDEKNFRQGAKAIAQSIKETFGNSGALKFSYVKKEGDDMMKADVRDDAKATWSIVQEFIRDEYSTTQTGWETVSPPIFNRDYLRNMAGFLLRLGQNPFGREAEFTGAHQTTDLLPQQTKFEPGLAGRTAANYLLLKQQFSPAIFKTLQVERYGGFKNFFIRPVVLDHGQMLQEISATPAQQLTIQNLERIMNDKYALAEFESHVMNSGTYNDERRKEMMAWSEKTKREFPKLWKYHDLRIHFKPEKPERTLVEDRTGDYRQGDAEASMRVTFFNQKLLTHAFEMAKAGKVHQMNIPVRAKGETDDAYWKRLSGNSASSQAALFDTLRLDETSRQLLRGETFKPRGPKFSVLAKPSYGFEKEFIGHEIIDLIVPKDPEARAKWRDMTFPQKVQYFANLIADGDEYERFLNEEKVEYTKDTRRIVTVEFEADTMKFPFLDPDLFLEDSGNWEIKSNGRDIYDPNDLFAKMGQTDKKLQTNGYGAHAHLFIPEEFLKKIRTTPGMPEKIAGFLERLSLLMLMEDFRESDPKDNYHALDSWSLDRYSARDLQQIIDWLKGQGKLGNIAQKYHNVGAREVLGGLDMELRAVGDDMTYAKELMTLLSKAFLQQDFGMDHSFGNKPGGMRPLFHDFQDAATPGEARAFTLYAALADLLPVNPVLQDIAFKLQFKIYQPVMQEYMFFDDFHSWKSVPADKLDAKMARTNFETNVVLPILNWSEQPYMQQEGYEKIISARKAYMEKVARLVSEIQKNPKYKFILENRDFMYLANWMERSTHPSKPNLKQVDEKTANAQRKILEDLIFKLRGYVIEFTQATEIPTMLRNSFDAELAKKTIKSPMHAIDLEIKSRKAAEQRAKAAVAPAARVHAPMCRGVWLSM